MSKDSEFIIDYISESSKEGSTPVAAAKKEIEEIDLFLSKAEKKKIRRMKLLNVLDHFADESYRRRRNASTPPSEDIDLNKSDDFQKIKKQIISIVSSSSKPLAIRDLISEVGSYDQDALIIRAVKALGDEEMISRNDDGLVQPGPKL